MSRPSTPALRRLPRSGALAAAALAAALTLSSCGGHDEHAAQAETTTTGTGAATGATDTTAAGTTVTGTTAAKAKFNSTDVAFVQGMIPHHQQAIEMSALVKSRTKNAKIVKLATGIHGAQDPEIKQMTGWLTAWGKELPSATVAEAHHDDAAMDDHAHAEGEADDHSHAAAAEEEAPHAHGGEDGMMTAAQLAGLKKLKGKAFEKQFLTLMIAHHAGAVTSAKNAIARGINPDVKVLCAAIVKGQTAEIKLMRKLLKAK